MHMHHQPHALPSAPRCCCRAVLGRRRSVRVRARPHTSPPLNAAAQEQASSSTSSSTSSRRRRSRSATRESSSNDSTSSPSAAPAAAPAPAEPPATKQRGGSKQRKQAVDTQPLRDALASRTQLAPSVAERVLAAVQGDTSMPSDPDKLCRRIAHLQQLLGPEDAQRALRNHAYILAYRPHTVAFNFKQWQLFFGTHDSAADDVSSPLARQLQQVRQQALMRKLVRHPQLLGVQVEQQVAGLYEVAVLLGEQDPQEFAFRAMDLSPLTANAVLDKLEAVLHVLNTPTPTTEHQHQQQQQQQQQQHQQELPAPPPSVTAAAAAGGGVAVPSPRAFTLADVQAAARRDHSWLALSRDTLEGRLRGIQADLGIPMSQVGAMFMSNPSLLNKRPSTLASKAAALRALPGMRPGHADAMAAALPSLLNLRPEKLQDRWQQLQQAAETHPAWSSALADMPPSTLAGMLIRGEGRYQRLQQVTQQRLQERFTLSGVLALADSAFEKRLEAGYSRHSRR